jgi:hypothetical protein
MILVATIAAYLSVVADNAASVKHTRPRGKSAPSGGIVEKPYSGNVLRIASVQTKVPLAQIQPMVQQMRWTSLLPFEVCDGAKYAGVAPIVAADQLAIEDGVGAAVLIVEDDSLPMTLVAPEKRWTILNIKPLLADAPAEGRIEERFTKMLWCAVARTLGAGYSGYKPCVLVPFTSLSALDHNPVTKPCPEPFNKMIDTGAVYGIKTITIASYRDACRRGWAPVPTNDVQKAIWDEVHALPASPIKIEFDPKKGR